MSEDETRLLEEFGQPNGELRMRDYYRYGATMPREGHYCTQCEKPIPEDGTVLNIVCREADWFRPEEDMQMEREFCGWDCATDWFEVQAGRRAYRP